MPPVLISVIGGHKANRKTTALARRIGTLIAEEGAILVCGGLGGVMEAAACGARSAGGLTIGILPGKDKHAANRFIAVPIPTGLGYTRNTLVAGCADMVIALAGKEGTLSEIGFALSEKKPVIGIDSWDIPGMIKAASVDEVRRTIHKLLKTRGARGAARAVHA